MNAIPSNEFTHDVFLSHSSKDKTVVRELAARLKQDGIRVWLDEEQIKPGDSIPAKIEEGLEHSRVLVLCMSANAFGSDWAQLEAGTFRFRDPLNKERRFIPLRLDDAPIKDSLSKFLYINWRHADREQEYTKLLEICRPLAKTPATEAVTERKKIAEIGIQLDCEMMLTAYAFSSDARRVVTGCWDNAVRLWDMETGRCVRLFEGHTASVYCVALSADGKQFLSGANDNTMRVWDIETGNCVRVFEGHASTVYCAAFSADQRYILSGSGDQTVRLWDVATGHCLYVLEGHTGAVYCAAWSANQRRAITGGQDSTVRIWNVETKACLHASERHAMVIFDAACNDQGQVIYGVGDNTLRLRDVETGRLLRVFEGHTNAVRSVAWSSNQRFVLSGSWDTTVRLWDVITGHCLHVFNGHKSKVLRVTWGDDQLRAFSGDENGGIRVWDLSKIVTEAQSRRPRPSPLPSAANQVQYTNAKVLLVGESGAGKTGLSKRLALNDWQPSDSTVGAWATQWKLPVSSADGVEREIWLWDFGGQADQRLIHQLYMDDTALAVLVFDGQKENVFETLSQWDRDLTRASQKAFTKLLVAGRVDAGGLRISRSRIEEFAKERGYLDFLETSAKTGLRCDELKQAILKGIRWEDVPLLSSTLLFKRLKEEIIRLKDTGRVLVRFNELQEALQLRLSGEATPFAADELKAVVGLLSGPGVVWELKFGSWVLLQPGRINAYAQAVIQTMRADQEERGCLGEERVLNGDLTYHRPEERLPVDEERFVLLAMHKILVERGLCLREHTEAGTVLIFPNYYRRERPELVGHPAILVTYRFNGFLDEIYATLVVRLHHTKPFTQDQLWRYAADFKTLTGKQLGVKLERLAEGEGELVVYADPVIAVTEKIIFTRYVHEHILQKGRDMVRLRHYCCPHCGTSVGNRDVAMHRLNTWLTNQLTEEKATKIQNSMSRSEPTILCAQCEKRVPLWDEMEQYFASDEVKERVRQLQVESDLVLDSESKDRALVGDVISTVALAGQIIEEYSAKRFGLDMEIEFKDDEGKPTAKKLYLQLKSGDSHLKKRERDAAEIFQIHDEDHAKYWMTQAYPVFLVISDSKGEVRWMEIRDYLKRESNNGRKAVNEIVFEGERFDVMSVRRWRDRVLGDPFLHRDRDSLLEILSNGGDEKTRCEAARQLLAWRRPHIRDRLIKIAGTDSSIEVRSTCFEVLCEGWWREYDVRKWARNRVREESSEAIQDRFALAIQNARKYLSSVWELKLSKLHSEEQEPESIPSYPAFRVSRFRLRDIGPFKDTGEIQLVPSVNVFLGDNAAGKTTLMRCLALAAIGLAAANEIVDNPTAYLRKGAERGSIEVLFEILPDPDLILGESAYFGVGLQITAGSSRFVPLQEMTIRAPSSDTRSENGAEPLSALRSTGVSQFGFVAGYGAVRTFSESRFATQSELKKQENEWVLSLFRPEAWLVNPENFSKLIRGDISNIEEGPATGLNAEMIEAMRKGLKHLFPEISAFFADGENDLQLNGTPLRVGDTSDGYRSLFALMGHLLRSSLRIRNWKDNPTEVHGIALIDEIDLHLHPAWQVHVVQDFGKAFPNLQLIASTHSPLVVAALKRENVMIMRREEDGFVVIERPDFDPQGLGVAGILTGIFSLSSTIDQPTLDKITRRIELHSKRQNWKQAEKQEYDELTKELTGFGFNREFSDPYFERFATAMAKRHRATLERLTPETKSAIDAYADQILADLTKENE